MYSSVHGVTGAIIMVAAPSPIIGIPLAFVSHFLLDYIGESSIGDKKQSSTIEGSLLLAFIIASLYSNFAWLALIGWVVGNLPDLIDKPNNWFRGKKQWFSCHDGKGLFQYKGKKLGYPVMVGISREQTLIVNMASVLLWCLIVIISK